MADLAIRSTDTTEDGRVVIIVDDNGVERRIVLNPIEAADLIMGLRAQVVELTANPAAGSWVLPGISHVQLAETEEMVLLRIFLGGRLSHDYPVPKGTTLADELKLMADRVAARQEARAIASSPESRNRKQ